MPNHITESPNRMPPHRKRTLYHHFLRAVVLSCGVIGCSLGLGTLGYHFVAGLAWVDALLNAAMILTGMGPVNTLNSDAAKLFATAYALFSGVVFVTATGIMLAPVFHWVLHRFHIEQRDVR